jgi:hypothetical protein
MASLQELQANFNAAFDALPVGQRIPWGGGTIYSMGGGRAYYDGPNGYQVLTKGQDVAQLAASNPYIAQQWAGEGYDLAPAQTFSTRPEQVMQAPEPVSVAAPATSTGSPASGPQFDAAGQYFGQGTDQAGYSGTFQDPATGQYICPRFEMRYNPELGYVDSVQAGWYAANGQNVGDMMYAYDMNGNADAANNVAISDTSDTLLDKLITGGILAGAGMGLGQLAGIGGQLAGAGDAFMPGALDSATGAVLGDATMPGALASFGANPATTSLGALAVGTGDAFLPGALNAATGTVLGDAYLPGALGSFGANPALTGATGPLALGGLGGGASALSSGTAGISGAGAAGTGTGSAAGVIGPATTGPAMMGPPTTATIPAGLEQYLKKPNVLDTIGSALGINGGTAATILGGLLGGQSNDESKTTANKLDPQMQAYLYGSGGLLPAVNSTLQSQLANGGLNALQRQGLTAQQNYLQSPEYAQQFAGLRNYGQGLLASGVAANPFATRGTNGLL